MKTKILNKQQKERFEISERLKNRWEKEAEAYKKNFWSKRKKIKTVDDIENELNTFLNK